MVTLNYTNPDGTSAGVTRKEPLPVEIYGPQTSPFSELMTAERTNVFNLSAFYGLSALRDIQETANGGTIALVNAELRLRTGATANGNATLITAERGVYNSGYAGQIGLGVRIPTKPTGNQVAKWGARADGEGIYFVQDAAGLAVARLSNSVETLYRQADWSMDRLDGNGPSGVRFDPADGRVCQIIFTYYGDGQIVWEVAAELNGVQRKIPFHAVKFEGELSLRNANLPIFAEVDNGGDAASLDLFVHGRQYSIIGDYNPKRRFTGQARGSVATGTTAVPLVTFQTKAGFQNRKVRISGYQVKPATEDIIIEARLNGTLTGASYATPTNHSAAETALQADISATAITGGEVVWTDFIEAGKNTNSANVASTNGLELDIPADQPITLCARTLTGTGTIVSHFRMAEDW